MKPEELEGLIFFVGLIAIVASLLFVVRRRHRIWKAANPDKLPYRYGFWAGIGRIWSGAIVLATSACFTSVWVFKLSTSSWDLRARFSLAISITLLLIGLFWVFLGYGLKGRRWWAFILQLALAGFWVLAWPIAALSHVLAGAAIRPIAAVNLFLNVIVCAVFARYFGRRLREAAAETTTRRDTPALATRWLPLLAKWSGGYVAMCIIAAATLLLAGWLPRFDPPATEKKPGAARHAVPRSPQLDVPPPQTAVGHYSIDIPAGMSRRGDVGPPVFDSLYNNTRRSLFLGIASKLAPVSQADLMTEVDTRLAAEGGPIDPPQEGEAVIDGRQWKVRTAHTLDGDTHVFWAFYCYTGPEGTFYIVTRALPQKGDVSMDRIEAALKSFRFLQEPFWDVAGRCSLRPRSNVYCTELNSLLSMCSLDSSRAAAESHCG
jgi:hypothetical protein